MKNNINSSTIVPNRMPTATANQIMLTQQAVVCERDLLSKHDQGFTFQASDRSRSLSLAQINNLGSDSLRKYLLFIMQCSGSNIRSSHIIHHRRWRLQPAAIRLQERHRSYAGHMVYKNYQKSGLTSICIMCKCHIMLYVIFILLTTCSE